VSPQARLDQARFLNVRGLSLRRACGLIGVARSGLHYQHRQPVKDAPVVESMKRLAKQYPRYGYRRIRIFLAREGLKMSVDRAGRLWRKARLQLPAKRPRRRPARSVARAPAPTSANRVWAYDFVFDACANGQVLKCLTVVDEFTHECLAVDVSGSIRSARVIKQLSRLITVHGAPTFIRSDNGPEFLATAIQKWLREENIKTAYIDPGKPWQNGVNESLNGKLRDECLNMEWFKNRRHSKVVIEQWRQHYNAIRPHMSLGYLTPHEFKQHLIQTDYQPGAIPQE
tara:strand:+ start:963 stop:1817 length:855 start_codon:yes stop_codon:yes gene_type:complete